jgi:hypothetical protein
VSIIYLSLTSYIVCRLSIAASTEEVVDFLAQLPSSSAAVYLCIQSCPLQRTLYSTLYLPEKQEAQVPANGKAAANAANSKIVFAKVIDKVRFLYIYVRELCLLCVHC